MQLCSSGDLAPVGQIDLRIEDHQVAVFHLFGDCPAAEPVFIAAANLLGRDPRRLVKDATPRDSVCKFQ
jgi:hypothetical protein